jgi:hypothetical protein
MSCTFRGAGLTESISTPVAGDSIHVGIVHGLHDPSTTPARIETSTAIVRLFERLQCRLNTTTAVRPPGVTEDHAKIV